MNKSCNLIDLDLPSDLLFNHEHLYLSLSVPFNGVYVEQTQTHDECIMLFRKKEGVKITTPKYLNYLVLLRKMVPTMYFTMTSNHCFAIPKVLRSLTCLEHLIRKKGREYN